MIDVSSFFIERARLRRFCFRHTRAAIVIRDVTDPKENDRIPRVAEFLQFLLTVDARRFVDPDDACADFGRSIFAFPTFNAKRDVATILAASNGAEAIVVDYRVTEAIWPLLAPTPGQSATNWKIWDRELRKRGRICAIITLDAAVRDIAIECDGGRLLRRSGGETFDLAGRFWQEAYNEIASQRCMSREAWHKNDFQTEGNA